MSVQFVLNNVECFKLIFTAITIDIELIGPDEHLKAFLATSNDLIIFKVENSFQESFVQAASAPSFAARAQEEKNTSMYGSYSGVRFASSFDPDNIAVDRQPICSGYVNNTLT